MARSIGIAHQTLRSYLAGGPSRTATRVAVLRWADDAAGLERLGQVAAPVYSPPPPSPERMAERVNAGLLPLWGSGA